MSASIVLLLNMLGTLNPEQKKDWKSHVPAMVHAYNCSKNAATGFSPYYLLFGREPRLPVDVEFELQRGNQRGPLGESNYVSQLRRRLKFAHNKAKQIASKQQARHKGPYDRKCRGATLAIGDLVLVKTDSLEGAGTRSRTAGKRINIRWWINLPLVFLSMW